MFGALIKKQFLELNAFYFQNKKTGKMRSKAGIIGYTVLFLLLFASIGFAFYTVAALLADSFVSTEFEWLYFSLTGLISIALGVFGSVFNTYAALYHAKDNELLLSMPIPPSYILASRVVGVYAMGLLYEAIIFVPSAIAYWVVAPFKILGVIMPVLIFFVIGFFILTLTCILGYFVALISSKLKNKSFITVILSLAFLAVYYFVYFRLNAFLQNVVSNAEQVGKTVKNVFYPFYQMGKAACGDVLSMLIFTALCLALFAITYFVLSRSFLSIVTVGDNGKKAVYRSKSLKTSSVSKALFDREMKHFLSSPTYMLNCGLGLVILPALAVLSLIKMRDINGLITVISVAAPKYVSAAVPVIVTVAICLMISMNVISAPSVSLEGKNIWILQSSPIESKTVLKAKNRLHITVNSVPAVLSAVLIGIAFKFDTIQIVLSTCLVFVFICFCGAFGLFLNIKNPNLSWTNETVPIKQSISVTIAIFGGWGIAIGFGALYFAVKFLPEKLYIAIFILIFGVLTALINRYNYKKGAEIFSFL